MAHFRGTVKGRGHEISQLGNDRLVTTTNGWNLGVRVEAARLPDGTDQFTVFLTGGLNRDRPQDGWPKDAVLAYVLEGSPLEPPRVVLGAPLRSTENWRRTQSAPESAEGAD